MASFLVKDLKVNWLIGAEYFESLLLDYDASSNYGNWRSVFFFHSIVSLFHSCFIVLFSCFIVSLFYCFILVSLFHSLVLLFHCFIVLFFWSYVAGCGCDPRKDRYFNVFKQGNEYDKQGKLCKHWIPSLSSLPSSFVHKPFEIPSSLQSSLDFHLGHTYPNPIIDPSPILKGIGGFGKSNSSRKQ